MTVLFIFSMGHHTLRNGEMPHHPVRLDRENEIRSALNEIGVRFERWEASISLGIDASDESILSAYSHDVQRLKAAGGYLSADVINVHAHTPEIETVRRKFRAEHIHHEDEVRFFVEGGGVFYLHVGQNVFAALLQAGDLISVPRGMLHWFDMGPKPWVKCIRLFSNPTGWIAEYSGDSLAAHFPSYPELLELR